MNLRPVCRSVLALLVLTVTLASCGGTASVPGSAAGPAETSSAPSEPVAEDEAPTEYTIHPAIADVPLLDPHEIPVPATAYPLDADPRETIAQNVLYTQSMSEVVTFYFKSLPAAGFEIIDTAGSWTELSQFVDGSQGLIAFRNSAGQEGQISFGLRQEGGVNILINLWQNPG